MNKVESIIKEELGKAIIDVAVKQIKTWAKKELNLLKFALDYPLIIPINQTKFIIDTFTISVESKNCVIVTKDNKLIHNFYSKKAAIFYCIFEKLCHYNLAFDVLNRDKKVAQVHDDLQFYSTKLTSKKYDSFKKELYYLRYLDSKIKMQTYQRDLEKTITNAKYMKIWEKIL